MQAEILLSNSKSKQENKLLLKVLGVPRPLLPKWSWPPEARYPILDFICNLVLLSYLKTVISSDIHMEFISLWYNILICYDSAPLVGGMKGNTYE